MSEIEVGHFWMELGVRAQHMVSRAQRSVTQVLGSLSEVTDRRGVGAELG